MHNKTETVTLGFWTYLMTDCVLFASFFATFAVLRNSTFGGPSLSEYFSLPYVGVETFILLTSSFTCGLAMIEAGKGLVNRTVAWFTVTLLLGVGFLVMELSEFRHLIADGHGPQQNAALSAYFSLVGLHGLHITVGVIWILVAAIHIFKRGLSEATQEKLICLSLFWHFLDVIWIFIFTVVYLYSFAL